MRDLAASLPLGFLIASACLSGPPLGAAEAKVGGSGWIAVTKLSGIALKADQIGTVQR